MSIVLGPTSSTPPLPARDSGDGFGPLFGGYRLIERLGKSRTSIVFRAIDPLDNADVALKIFLGNANAAEGAFLREVNAEHRLLEHDHILRYLYYGKHAGLFFVATPYCELGTLEDYRREHRLTRTQSLGALVQIADAIDYAHARGVIHADLKPTNVLVVDHDPYVVVSDFSLAHVRGAASVTGPHGTRGWSADEQLDGMQPSPAADVYAFAKIALWLFDRTSVADVRIAGLRQLLERALDVVPRRRPAIAALRIAVERARNSSQRPRPRGGQRFESPIN